MPDREPFARVESDLKRPRYSVMVGTMCVHVSTLEGICTDVVNWINLCMGQEVKKAVEADQEALQTAIELIEDLRSYCREGWDWKYKDYWDEETAKVKAAIRSAPGQEKGECRHHVPNEWNCNACSDSGYDPTRKTVVDQK